MRGVNVFLYQSTTGKLNVNKRIDTALFVCVCRVETPFILSLVGRHHYRFSLSLVFRLSERY